MSVPSWIVPLAATLGLFVWVYLGGRAPNGRGPDDDGKTIMLMRSVGAILLSASIWLIWWLA